MVKGDAAKSYSDTLNLPKTQFDMRAALLKKEPDRLKGWAEKDIYARLRAERAGGPRYILHDGPPYANGEIHMGHLLNKVLKDFVVRYKTMIGCDSPFVPGWDCHGLPIEAKVMEQLGRSAGEMDRMAIREKCRHYAEQFIEVQKEQFKRLGVWGQFDDPYVTMDPAYEADVLEVFARLVAQGVVYRQLKPVHWSIENRTALADAELEYHDRQDTSIYVLFSV
ncbi:MAG: class I tRNA ligase family protein, partial [Planctomycetes bacterium]|nr:class I tRNA ligase family protein [Planctomycetota bacterium]